MAPGTELTAEIIEVMDSYWRSYFTGDLSTWASYLPDDYKNIGSTREEIWNSKQEIVNYTLALKDQMVGMAELRNKQVQIFPYDPYFMVHELGDLYIKTDEGWSFYSTFRLSSLLRKTEQGWKILHQHGSYPDARTEEGEAFAFQQISRENRELREAVRRRTAELEYKNRELETEAALEKVRATAMAMRKPEDMLLVCRTISGQLETLGVKNIRNIQTVIINTESKEYLNYQYFSPYHTDAVEKIDYTSHPVVNEFVEEMLRSDQAFFTKVFEGKELDEWRQHRSVTGQFPDAELDRADAVHYYFFSIGSGALGMSTYAAVSEESLQIFRRFKNVFELSYKRYLDIALAEAQAREAQIEAALEKIRSRSLAMHQSKELKEVIAVFFEKLNELGVLLGTVAIQLFDQHSMDSYMWVGNTIQDPQMVCLPYDQKMMQNDTYLREAWEAMKTGKDLINREYTREQKDSFFDFIFLHNDFVQIPPSAREVLRQMDSHICCLIPEKNSALFTDSWNQQRYSPESVQILKRAARVFEQAYIRFLDLQKAEAQAREAEIQLALERVRAKTMAMQKSEELPEAANLLFQQVQSLGMPAWSAGYCIWDDESRHSVTLWMSSEGVLQPPFRSPTTEDELFLEMRKGAEQGKELHIVEMGGEKLEKHYQYMRKLPVVGEILDSIIAAGHPLPSFQIMHQAYFSKGFLLFITYEHVPEAHEIFKRLAGVFDQTYTRFLDLQKAEAQAREAQIEAALEKVRSRSLAMHKSDELEEVIMVVSEQLQQLQFRFHNVSFGINNEREDFEFWMASPGFDHPFLVKVPYIDNPALTVPLRSRKNGIDFISGILTPEENQQWLRHVLYHSDLKNVSEENKSFLLKTKSYARSQVLNKHTILTVGNYAGIPYSEEQNAILKRFGNVFEQAFVRFLDLQKAEAQAREAQIEAALERVRAQTMSMHNSEDVGKCILRMFSELTALGVYEDTRFGIGILNHDNENNQLWTAKKDGEEVKLHIGNLNMSLHPLLQSARKAWKEQVPFHRYILEGEDLLNYYRMLNNAPDYKLRIPVEKLPEREIHYGFIFDQGFFYAFSPHEFTSDLIHIIQRFSSQFGQTYRRYLDLVKAEGQAREAEIELALERVRARTMAMQKSDELNDVVAVLFDKLKELRIPFTAVGIAISMDGSKDLNAFVCGENEAGLVITNYRLPYFTNKIAKDFNHILQNKLDLFVGHYSKEEKDAFYGYLIEHTAEFMELPEDIRHMIFESPSYTVTSIAVNKAIFNVNDFGGNMLAESEMDIIRRFARVFDQTYTRFLDLQKAEAQAREARVESSLERVRSATMAMHQSKQILDVITVLCDQLIHLGFPLHAANIVTNFNGNDYNMWLHSPGAPMYPDQIIVPDFGDYFPEFIGAYREGKEYAVTQLNREQKNHFFDHLFTHTIIKNFITPERKNYLYNTETYTEAWVIRKNTILSVVNYDGIEYTAEQEKILKRFSYSFEQSFTRFLDLQKAEELAREAEIELSMERIRAHAMAMKESADLLDIVVIMRNEFVRLGHEAHYFWHMRWLPETYEKAMTSGDGTRIGMVMQLPRGFHEDQRMLDWEKSQESIGIFTYDADSAINYVDKMIRTGRFDLIDHNAPGPDDIRAIGGITFIMARTTHGEIGYSLPGIVPQPPAEDLSTLVRFAGVFDLAYKRFEDLKMKEWQNRQSQIELALERVRSRTMAMQKSDELKEVAHELRVQLASLGTSELETCAINLYDEYDDFMEAWVALRPPDSEKDIQEFHFLLPKQGIAIIEDMLHAYSSGSEEYLFELNGEKGVQWMNTMSELVPEMYEAAAATPEFKTSGAVQAWFSCYYFPGGALIMITMTTPEEESKQILKRCTQVFGHAYRRFSDLKKAEAQAREAQIEAALEKVRARSLAMHKSEDLQTVVNSVFDRLKELEIEMDTSSIIIPAEDTHELVYWFTNAQGYLTGFKLPRFNNVIAEDIYREKENGNEIFSKTYTYRGKNEFWHHLFQHSEFSRLPDDRKKFILDAECFTITIAFTKNTAIQVNRYYNKTFTAAETAIIQRFAIVFEQAYTRFLDLQKAEAQAREAQIEAALEKIRSRSLAMHKSEELREVVAVVFEKLIELHFPLEDAAATILIFTPGSKDHIQWISDPGHVYENKFFVPYTTHALSADLIGAKLSGSEYFSRLYDPEVKNEYFRYLFENTDYKVIPYEIKELILGSKQYGISVAFGKNSGILIPTNSGQLLSAEQAEILKRFSRVLEQSYVRFLDLQKAEAQAREAEIELSLERVRARAMAMQTSEELNALIGTVFTELIKLDLVLTRCVLMIFNPETKHARWWMANSEAPGQPMNFLVPYHENPVYLGYLQHWKERASKWVYILEGKQKTEWDDFLFRESELSQLPDFVIRGMREPERVYLNVSFYAFGGLTLASLEPLSDHHFDILKRFGKVFDLTYTRFNDLKLAEAQAREAKIEAALERIRARALGMQKSGDLFQVAMVLREQMGVVGQPDLESSIIHLYHHDTNMLEAWYAYCPPGHPVNQMVTGVAFIPFNESEWSREVLSGYLSGDQDYTIVSTGDKLREWYAVLEKRVPEVVEYNAAGELIIPGILYYHFSKFGGGALLTISNQQPSLETRELQKKAAAVFDFAFTRFLDLQKAEDQAREANIETALEKVRGKAMSMQNSEDLTSTIAVFYHEIQGLGLTPRRCGVGLLNKESRMAELSTQNTTEEGNTVEIIGNLRMTGHPVLEGVYENWIQQKEYHPVLQGNEIRDYYQVLKPQIVFPDYPHDEVQYGYFFFFDEGGVYAWYDKPLEEDELNIYRRFTRVIQLTYKRYLDLKNSEANALEAIRQSSLDRLRAEISSMRSKQDLEKITPLLWNELKVQGVPFIRCGVFLMDEKQQLVHTFLSTPEGSAIASFHLPFGIDPNINAVVDHWRSKNIYQTHWDVQAFMEWTNTLVRYKAITAGDTYLKNFPAEGLYLCFIPFQQGMLYAGNSAAFKPEHIRQMESLSSTFSAAYARYEDFIRLELAKMQVENTLEELKLTQSQLIQAEKMASLGQLTAGIAHEIQNPLNFVNNFSDVSKELLDEMKAELATGNVQQAVGIADDITGNLEKILHHGKRADSIVKAMLQHSRSVSGQKELTDINSLCEEYVRLAYHGLRAKDKGFNAKVETNLDLSCPKANLIPQEIGRVILNLINNAFYAVNEKWKVGSQGYYPGYQPQVVVSTRNGGDKIVISVKDNGNGIPDPIRGKIFQPFFTTKPTGQGTGLGLSLSYDIVKAHGGELDAETKEGAGTTFYVRLPVQ